MLRSGRTPLIYTIILNTNRRDDTLACLASLEEAGDDNVRVCVLDNASTDGSVEAIRERFPWVELLPLAENLGYAGNNNVGIAHALAQGADWVFVLNEDTILAPDCMRRMMAVANADSTVGIVGPLVLHHDEPLVVQSAGGHVDRFLRPTHLAANEGETVVPDSPREVDWISGCAICVRAEVIRQVGMLDTRYFYYWEETEWCLRARQAGWRILLEPQARLWHKGVQRNYRPGPNVAYYNTRNRLLTLAKHQAPPRAWLVAYGEILRTLASYSVRPKWRPQRAHRDAIWAGLVDFHRGQFGQRQHA